MWHPLHPLQDIGMRLQLVHAPERIGMDLAPTEAVRRFKEASIVVAAGLVGSGQADALVSAGNTGVTMVAALRAFGRIRGVERPAVATVVPPLQGPGGRCGVGANVDCRPSHLVAFAQMGSVYAEQVLGIPETQSRPIEQRRGGKQGERGRSRSPCPAEGACGSQLHRQHRRTGTSSTAVRTSSYAMASSATSC